MRDGLGRVRGAPLLLLLTMCAVGCPTQPTGTNPCPGGICVGDPDTDVVEGDGGDACANVVCASPPSACHAANGTCADGVCTYALVEGKACDDGNACTSGDACSAAGVCAGAPIVCNTPPAATCLDGDTSRVNNPQGSCDAGNCDYASNTVSCPGQCGANQPGLCPSLCDGVTCNAPPSPCHVAVGTCVEGACTYSIETGKSCDDGNACTNGDTCDAAANCLGVAVSCADPPAPACLDADTSQVYNAQGSCAAGACEYTATTVNCPGVCGSTIDGVCPDACATVTCDAPPSACYASPGTCTDGTCSYDVDPAATTCDDGDACTVADACQADGSCLGTGLACDAPPAAECLPDGTTLRTYNAAGASCSDGTCNYPSSDTTCPNGCAAGACVPGGDCDELTCSQWDIPWPPNGTATRTCGDADCAMSKTLPANLDETYFRCFVQPIFTMNCANLACHSNQTPPRRLRIYARMLGRVAPLVNGKHGDGPVDPTCQAGNCDVDPLSAQEWAWNYDTARMLADEGAGAENELVRQPLSSGAGGLQHDGWDIFASTNDVRYQAILNWLGGATADGSCNGTPAPVTNGIAPAQLDDYGCPNCYAPSGYTCPGVPSGQSPLCDPAACMP